MYKVKLPITYQGEVVGEAEVGISIDSGIIMEGHLTDDDFLDKIRSGGVPGLSLGDNLAAYSVCTDPECEIHNEAPASENGGQT